MSNYIINLSDLFVEMGMSSFSRDILKELDVSNSSLLVQVILILLACLELFARL